MNFRQAVADYPASLLPAALLRAYPEATHVVLTLRRGGVADWKASMAATLVHAQLRRAPDDPSPMARLARTYHGYRWGGPEGFGEAAAEVYEGHNEEVRRLLREEDAERAAGEGRSGSGRKVLEFVAGRDGWSELCAFLGVDVPIDGEGKVVEYPRADDWVAYKKMVERESAEAGGHSA